MSYISQIQLHNFRCYEQARLEGLGTGLIVLSGPNGAGKTNVLEAISLLSPGRGLRSASVQEIQHSSPLPNPPPGGGRESAKQTGGGAGSPWAISASVETEAVQVKLGTGLDPQKDKRIIRINGENAKSQAALADYLACVWLTPQMDRLFLEGPSGRRRFFDRLVYAFDPGHSGRVTRYENAMRQRSKILQNGETPDPAWLSGLEAQMAETGVAIAAARLDFIHRLQRAIMAEADTNFPKAAIALRGTTEELLQKDSALKVEELLSYQLEQSRARDSETGGAASGPHKSDLNVRFAAKDMEANQCSTGEQKALLIGIILAHARLIAGERGSPPVLLLDEIAAHLDEGRRAALFDLLGDLGGQVWMTGTDSSLFSAIQNKAQFFGVELAQISLQKQGLAA